MIFNKWKSRCAQLEASLEEQKRINDIQQQGWHECESRAADLRNQVDYLVRTIRDMDDKLFSISQCTDWPQMRPRINALVEDMTVRKVAESKRIGALVERELHETYKPEPDALKQITKGK